MYNAELVDMIVRQHNAQKIAIKQIKIKSIHKDIIRLKQENRNIEDKVRSFYKHLKHNTTKMHRVEGHAYMYWYKIYEDRMKRDLTTIEYLQKLQEYNSKLINKHRAKIKSLRSKLQELKKELSVLKGEKE